VDEGLYYSIKEAAKAMNYSERQMRQLCITGKVNGAFQVVPGGKWLGFGVQSTPDFRRTARKGVS
jgi:hypothetical protein